MARNVVVDDSGPLTRAERRAFRLASVVGFVVMALTVPPPAAAGGAESDTGSQAKHVWLDAEGQPLLFQENAEIEAFLRDARVVSREEIGVGINKMDKLLVEKDGVRAHAIFRDIDEEHDRLRVGDRTYMRFKDSWAGECAAYAIARLFGIDNVPPTVKRTLDGQQGSMQIWVEKTRDHTAKDFSPPSPMAWVKQTWGMFVFDNLIFNADRNSGNILAGEHYRLWLIDHTRAFQPSAELMSPDRVERLSRRAWARLLEISEEELADATREYLDPGQIGALKERRRLLVQHLQARIDKAGEDAILY
jgi:hypothetical protein